MLYNYTAHLSVDKFTIGIRELRQRDSAKINKKSGDRDHGLIKNVERGCLSRRCRSGRLPGAEPENMGLMGLMGPMGSVVQNDVSRGGAENAEDRKTWGQWVLWVLWGLGLWGALSPANAGREMPVQNGFGVVPSVSDGGSEPLSQSESTTLENILHTGGWNVQNAV